MVCSVSCGLRAPSQATASGPVGTSFLTKDTLTLTLSREHILVCKALGPESMNQLCCVSGTLEPALPASLALAGPGQV